MQALNECSAQIEELTRVKDDWKDRHETKDLELKSSRVTRDMSTLGNPLAHVILSYQVAISQLAAKVTALERQVNRQLKETEQARETQREPLAEATIGEAKEPITSPCTTPMPRVPSDSKASEQTGPSSTEFSERRAQDLETNIKLVFGPISLSNAANAPINRELHQQIEITNKRAAHLGTMLKTAKRVLFLS